MTSAINQETHSGFPCTVYYRDDDNNSGYGENARVAYWYGDNAPADLPSNKFKPLVITNEPDSFDLACERRHD